MYSGSGKILPIVTQYTRLLSYGFSFLRWVGRYESLLRLASSLPLFYYVDVYIFWYIVRFPRSLVKTVDVLQKCRVGFSFYVGFRVIWVALGGGEGLIWGKRKDLFRISSSMRFYPKLVFCVIVFTKACYDIVVILHHLACLFKGFLFHHAEVGAPLLGGVILGGLRNFWLVGGLCCFLSHSYIIN